MIDRSVLGKLNYAGKTFSEITKNLKAQGYQLHIRLGWNQEGQQALIMTVAQEIYFSFATTTLDSLGAYENAAEHFPRTRDEDESAGSNGSSPADKVHKTGN